MGITHYKKEFIINQNNAKTELAVGCEESDNKTRGYRTKRRAKTISKWQLLKWCGDNFSEKVIMKVKKICVLIAVLLFLISLPYKMCFADSTSLNHFHSQLNGYSVAIPEGWKQVPEKVIQQAFEMSFSENKLTFDIETILAIEFEKNSFQYPYAVIQVTRYSKYDINRALKKEEIKEAFKVYTKELRLTTPKVEHMDGKLSERLREVVSQIEYGTLYLDKENMSYLLGSVAEVASIGRVKSLLSMNFGRYAMVKIRFICIESDWHRFGNDRDLILHSFKFDPARNYKGAQKKNNSFWEDSLVDIAVYGIVALIIVLIGLVALKRKQ